MQIIHYLIITGHKAVDNSNTSNFNVIFTKPCRASIDCYIILVIINCTFSNNFIIFNHRICCSCLTANSYIQLVMDTCFCCTRNVNIVIGIFIFNSITKSSRCNFSTTTGTCPDFIFFSRFSNSSCTFARTCVNMAHALRITSHFNLVALRHIIVKFRIGINRYSCFIISIRQNLQIKAGFSSGSISTSIKINIFSA